MNSLAKNILTPIIIACSLTIASVALAQEDGAATTSAAIEPETEVSSGNTGPNREVNQQNKADRQANLEAKKDELRANIQDNQAARQDKIETMQADRQDRIETRQANMAERKVALQARAQERVTNLAANMSNRMDSIIARLQNITDRINARIEKLDEAGVDTTNAVTALAAAQQAIDAATAEIADIDVAVTAAVTSEDARAGWQTVKSKYSSIRDHIKTAHTELRATVAALKTAVAEMNNQGASAAVRANTEANGDNN